MESRCSSLTTRRPKPGAFFGEMALLTAEARNAYVRSVDTLEVFVLAKANLQKVKRLELASRSPP